MLDTVTYHIYSKRQIILSLIILLVCCAIGYWPVSAGIFSLKNDATLYFLPVRYQVSEMIRNGHFPFWTSFINLGHPLYTDMQSGVWNPIVWLLSVFGSYTMRSLQMELLIYVYISGISMLFLLKYFKLHPVISLSLAVCYMLCGFNSDSAQFAYWIAGTAFLPLVFLFFLKTLFETSWKQALLFSFSMYMLFVTGYPGEFIIIFYFLLSYFIIHVIRNRKDFLKLFKVAGLSVLVFFLLSLPVIMAYASGLQYITRGGAVNYDLTMTNSMHPATLISWLFPLAAWKVHAPGTDILGRNSFIGLMPFLLLLISFLIRSKNSIIIFLKWVCIISLIFSLGKLGLLRSAAYYVLPYMDTFRHPSLFRFLTIFCSCILAAYTLQQLLVKKEISPSRQRIFFIVAAIMLIIPLGVLVAGTSMHSFFPEKFSIGSVKKWLDQSSAGQWFIIELLIQLPFLFLIYRYFIKKINLKIIGLLCISNSLIHTMLIQPVTVVRTETVESFQTTIDEYTQTGFPLPDLNSTINSNSFADEQHSIDYGPVNMFNKKTGYQYVFVTPGPLISHEKFMADDKLSKNIFNFPILYSADTALSMKDPTTLSADQKFVISDDTAVLNYVNSDRVNPSYKVRSLKFSPTELEFEIQSDNPGFYCLTQNFYPKWQLLVNNKKEIIYPCNISMMGFKVPAGKNIVTLRFIDNRVLTACYLQLAALLTVVLLLLKFGSAKNKAR